MPTTKTTSKKSFFTLLGLEAMDDAQKGKLLEDASRLLEKRVFLRIFDNLSEADKKIAVDVFEGNNEDAKIEFLKKRVKDFAKLVNEEVEKFKKEMKTSLDAKVADQTL